MADFRSKSKLTIFAGLQQAAFANSLKTLSMEHIFHNKK